MGPPSGCCPMGKGGANIAPEPSRLRDGAGSTPVTLSVFRDDAGGPYGV